MQTFPLASPGLKPLWILAVVLVPLTIVLLALAWGTGSPRFEVTAEGLRLRGDFYGRFIPAAQLDIARARRVNLDATPELRPRRRTMGTGLPGYQAGWFRLQNGETALLYLTDRSRAVHIPTRDGYSLLLSPTEPDRFLDAIRAGRASGP